MSVNTIPTNDVFKDICILLRIHKDKDLIIDLFKEKGWEVTRAKIKAWSVRAGGVHRDYRPMPEKALRDFIEALKDEKLLDDSDLDDL